MDPRLAVSLRQIGRLEELLGKLAKIPSPVAKDVAPQISALVQKQFKEGTDPYGRPWRKLMRSTLNRGRTPPPLTDTGKLRDGTKAYAIGNAVHVVVGMPYGYFHQVGTRRMVARRILPQAGMPKAWNEALKTSFRKLAKGVR